MATSFQTAVGLAQQRGQCDESQHHLDTRRTRYIVLLDQHDVSRMRGHLRPWIFFNSNTASLRQQIVPNTCSAGS
jgi:hypothetical protein